MVIRKQKGQGLTEFALILPLLLLLLLGIIEASRVIWAYVTVQQAAREAARFAVTGRPYLDANESLSGQEPICRDNDPAFEEPDPVSVSGAQPWLCEETTLPDGLPYNPRVEAIKQIAIRQGRNLNVSVICGDQPELFDPRGAEYNDPDCVNTPGAFGVLVQGQVTTETISGTLVVWDQPVFNHPGLQGLNVQISTFYNIEMITPVYDLVMGGNFLRLEGRVQLQNEGLDEAAGIDPPPPLDPPPPPPDTCPPDCSEFEGNEQIWATDGVYTLQESDSLKVHLEDHEPLTVYRIYLDTYYLCNATTDINGEVDVTCALSSASPSAVLPGTYSLFSTLDPTSAPAVATSIEQVTVVAGGSPQIEVEGGYTWAANSITNIILKFHDAGNQPFTLKLYDPNGNFINDITTTATGQSSQKIPWSVADIQIDYPSLELCDQASGKFCTIKSIDTNGDEIKSVQVQINQPRIVLSSGPGPYARGEQVNILLRAHTPGHRYTVLVQGPSDSISYATLDTDSAGDTTTPIALLIPTDCGFGGGWPDGIYTVESIPLGQTEPQIAFTTFEIQTPPDPFLTVDGGYTWTAGSSIDIRVHQHDLNAAHYLTFDGEKIPTIASDDTFLTGDCGDAIVNFTIPDDLAAGDYELASFLASDDSSPKATRTITVLNKPLIIVAEGDTVLPDQTITIQLINHIPNFTYRVFYAGKQLFAVVTDDQGEATVKYNLGTELPKLPKTPPPDLTNSSNYGTPYELNSQTVATPVSVVAKTNLTIQGADLVVTSVNVPVQATVGTTIPVVVTVQNVQPVGINRWVDIDLYFDPEPIAPSYLKGYNFPGDIKYWKDSIGPNEIFTITHQLPVTEFGLQDVYGYADTSGKVFEGEQSNEINNANNINNSVFLVECLGGQFADTFSADYAQGAAIPGWSWTTYGNGNNKGFKTQVVGGQLLLNNSGSSNWQSNDNNGGQSLLYRTVPLASASGLDLAVQFVDVELIGSFSKAGLEIRDSLNNTSPRVVWGVARNNGDTTYKRQIMQAGYRNGGGMTQIGSDISVDQQDGPIWLRIRRDPGANGKFYFYYKQTGASPPPFDGDPAAVTAFWGTPQHNIAVPGIGDNVIVGLFNSPYQSNTAGTAKFEEFRVSPDPVTCGGAEEVEPFPPGLQICTEVLDDRSFENPATSTSWFHRPDQPAGITLRTSDGGANNGVFKYRASSGTEFSVNPAFHFYQEFSMPDWVISSTTKFDLQVYKKVRSYMSNASHQQADQVYAVVVAPPTPGALPNPATWIQLTDPALVVDGQSTAPVGSFETQWLLKTATLTPAAGVNLEDYKNEKLYIYFYNNSNSTGACPGGCRTQFDFDDASLVSCTTQPKPAPVTTRIQGKLTLNFSDSSFGELPFVKVWAYAANNSQVYETFTIQGGEFNFYNLPATTAGTEYTIFAQYYLEQGNQLETLQADTTTTLISGVHNDANPARAFLNLFTLEPLQ
jgi:hypothetical protein